jgi:hypothetical protein
MTACRDGGSPYRDEDLIPAQERQRPGRVKTAEDRGAVRREPALGDPVAQLALKFGEGSVLGEAKEVNRRDAPAPYLCQSDPRILRSG